MSRIVADASFCGAWILPDEVSGEADILLAEALHGTKQIIVPSLWIYEMANLLSSALKRGRLDRPEYLAAGEALHEVPIHSFDLPDAHARNRIMEIAQTHHLSAYDAAYLELATRLKVPLKTTDRKLLAAYGAD